MDNLETIASILCCISASLTLPRCIPPWLVNMATLNPSSCRFLNLESTLANINFQSSERNQRSQRCSVQLTRYWQLILTCCPVIAWSAFWTDWRSRLLQFPVQIQSSSFFNEPMGEGCLKLKKNRWLSAGIQLMRLKELSNRCCPYLDPLTFIFGPFRTGRRHNQGRVHIKSRNLITLMPVRHFIYMHPFYWTEPWGFHRIYKT